jgi:type IV secretory pathway VirB10-like protein
MKKELLCGLCAALLLVSLSACSTQADQPNEPDPTPSAIQTVAPSMEPSKAVSVQSTETPTEAVTPEPSPVLEESAEPSATIPETEPPAPATAAPISNTPVATEQLAPPAPSANVVDTTTISNGEESDSPKNDIDRYPADPSIVPYIPEGRRFWRSDYVGEIEGYVYSGGLGYFPEGGSFTSFQTESTLPDFYDIVDPD